MILKDVSYLEYGFLVFNALYFRENQTFQRSISPPSSGWKSKPNKNPAEAVGKPGSYLVCSSALKVEAICFSEMSFLQTTWCYDPKTRILHSDYCENLKFNMYAIYAIFIILHKDGMKWNDHSNGNGCQM
jgi:hypothetical protein